MLKSDRIHDENAIMMMCLQVLEVHEQIEKPMSEQVHDGDSDVMDEEDKALLRNLCNVRIFVWISIECHAS